MADLSPNSNDNLTPGNFDFKPGDRCVTLPHPYCGKRFAYRLCTVRSYPEVMGERGQVPVPGVEIEFDNAADNEKDGYIREAQFWCWPCVALQKLPDLYDGQEFREEEELLRKLERPRQKTLKVPIKVR